MSRTANVADEFSIPEEALCWAIGLGFTLALFWSLAHFEEFRPPKPAPDILEMTSVSVPLEPPPPPRTVEAKPKPAEEMVALAGLDAGRSDSPVHIAVVPPDLESLVPTAQELPGRIVKFGYLDADLKPRVEVEVDVQHVYQMSEVDRPPRAIVRVAPAGVGRFFINTNSLRVELMFIINVDGHAVNVRVVQSSGQPEFDQLVAKTVEDRWEFSPAIRRGKRVRCLALQGFRVTTGGDSPFSVR